MRGPLTKEQILANLRALDAEAEAHPDPHPLADAVQVGPVVYALDVPFSMDEIQWVSPEAKAKFLRWLDESSEDAL